MDQGKFSTQIKCFELIGFQRNERFPWIHRVIPAFQVFCKVFFVASQTLFAVHHLHDILDVAEACATLFTGIITISKIISLSISKGSFYELMDEIKMLSKGSSNSNWQIIKEFNKLEKRVTIIYSIITVCAGIFFCVTPLIKNLINVTFYAADYNYEMPMKSAFPYDVTSSPAYELTYFIFSVAIFVTVFICIGVDSLFFGSCLHISAHLNILRESADDFGDKRLFVERHNTILNSMQLCVIGFHLVVSKSTGRRIIFATFGCSVVIQLFIYASGGQLIKDKSEGVADNLFKMEKDSMIIIARAQQPSIIKAGIYEASLPTLAGILRSAGSLMTALKSFI